MILKHEKIITVKEEKSGEGVPCNLFFDEIECPNHGKKFHKEEYEDGKA